MAGVCQEQELACADQEGTSASSAVLTPWSMSVKAARASRVALLKLGRKRIIWEHTDKQTVLLRHDSAFMLVFE